MQDGSDLTWIMKTCQTPPTSSPTGTQADPARQLPHLQKMPIAIVTADASSHAPCDHCTVKVLQQAGVTSTWLTHADLGITGNSHHMLPEKNSQEIVAAIDQWLETTMPPTL